MKDFEKAQDALNKACGVMNNDGYCKTRLIYSYLYQKNFNKAKELWSQCCNELKSGGINDDLLNCYTNYIKLYENIDDDGNNNTISSWSGDDKESFIGTCLKLFVMAFKSGNYLGEERYNLPGTPEGEKAMSWTDKNSDLAQEATHKQRMVASFLKFFVDMYTNDDIEDYGMQGMTYLCFIYFVCYISLHSIHGNINRWCVG